LPVVAADFACFVATRRGIDAALGDVMQSINLQDLEAVTGGKGKSSTTTKTDDKQNAGQKALAACLSGAGSAVGKKPAQVALGCALGAGKSILGSLGGLFGGSK
jgi:hypothetical protein